MDRKMIYPGQIPLETDLLDTNRFALIGLGKLAAAVLGTSTFVNGLACTPTAPASMQVQVAPGEIYSLQNLDGTAYSSLAADTTHSLLKQGLMLDSVTLNCPAPTTVGYSINYLVQATYQDTDANAVVLPYYNASNPTQAYSGPNNSGTAQSTVRKGVCAVNVKAGIAATTGTQITPAPDSGYVGLFVVTVAYGQASIAAGNISQHPNAPIIPAGGLISGFQSQSMTAFTTTGATGAFVLTPSPALTAYAASQRFRVKFHAVGNGSDTINVSGLGAKSLKQYNQAGVKTSAAIFANQLVDVEFDGVDFVLLDPVPSGLSAPFISYGAATTLTDAVFGKAIALYGASAYTVTLPVSTASNAGGVISFTAQQGSTTVTIAGQSSQTIQANGTAISSIAMQPGDTLMLVSGGSGWYVLGGSAQSGYAYSRHSIAPASRVANTNYTNTTGKLMWVQAVFAQTSAFHAYSTGTGPSMGDAYDVGNAGYGRRIIFPVLPGETYGWSYNSGLAVPTLNSWTETY